MHLDHERAGIHTAVAILVSVGDRVFTHSGRCCCEAVRAYTGSAVSATRRHATGKSERWHIVADREVCRACHCRQRVHDNCVAAAHHIAARCGARDIDQGHRHVACQVGIVQDQLTCAIQVGSDVRSSIIVGDRAARGARDRHSCVTTCANSRRSGNCCTQQWRVGDACVRARRATVRIGHIVGVVTARYVEYRRIRRTQRVRRSSAAHCKGDTGGAAIAGDRSERIGDHQLRRLRDVHGIRGEHATVGIYDVEGSNTGRHSERLACAGCGAAVHGVRSRSTGDVHGNRCCTTEAKDR